MKKIIQNPAFVIVVIALAAVAVGFYAYFSLTKGPSYNYTKAVTKDITESINLTGQVKAAQAVDLAFERAGKVSWVPVSVGDNVYAGQTLASLDSQDALADLASAKAALALANAQAGLQSTGSLNAKSALLEAQKSILDKIQNAYFASDDAVRTQASQIFVNPITYTPQLSIAVQDQSLVTLIQNERHDLENMLVDWNKEITQASSTSDFVALSGHSRQNILAVKTFLDNCAEAINTAIISPNLSAATMSGWKLAITTSRASVGSATVALSGADSQLTASQSAYVLAQQQIQTSNSTNGVAFTSLSQAQIDAAQANVDKANSALSKTVLRAPFDGIVSRMDAKVGQTVAVGTAVAGVISNANYQIEGYVSESGAAKINLGQMASTTLDAYGSSVDFPVKVILVDPAATMQNGVSSYKVTFEFIGNDARVKTGMTANVSVFVASKKDAFTVPNSAIVRRGADDYVLISATKNGGAALRKVTLGIAGDDGSVEVLSGLTPYDLVVSLNNSSTTTQ